MTENVRKRISKWDMMAEPNAPGEAKQENTLFVNADDHYKETQLHSQWTSNADAQQISLWQDREADDSMKKNNLEGDDMCLQSSELEEGSKMSSWEALPGHQATEREIEVNRQTDEALGQGYISRTLPGLDSRKQRSRISPRDRSSPNRSRSRSRSWSRSPSNVKHGPDRWMDRRRTGAGQAPPCRDFAAGRCRRGNQCRFLHDDRGFRDSNRHYDKYSRESRFERGRYSEHDCKENLSGPWDQSDYLRNKPSQRHGSHYGDEDWPKHETNRSNKATELCHDFSKGRCHRGSSCRYLHHEASSVAGWSMKDDSRGRTSDRREFDASFGGGFEPRRVNGNPCKFFAEGRCRRGQNCRFSHQGILDGDLGGRQHHDKQGYDLGTTDSSSRNASNWGGQASVTDTGIPSQLVCGNHNSKTAATQSMEKGDSSEKPQHPQSQGAEENEYQSMPQGTSHNVLASQVQHLVQEASLPHLQALTVSSEISGKDAKQQNTANGEKLFHEVDPVMLKNAGNQRGMNTANNLLNLAPVTGQNLAQNEQSPFIVPQLLHAQSFAPNIPLSQVAPPLHFNGQMHQVVYPMPQNGQSQFIGPLTSLNSQHLNPIMQDLPIFPPAPIGNQQNSNLGGQIQQNVPAPPNGQCQQNLNLNVLNSSPQPSTLDGQNHQHMNLSGQIPQDTVPNGQNQQNNNLSGQGHQGLLPLQSGQSQQNIQSLALAPIEQNQGFNLEKHQISSQHMAGEVSSNIQDSLEVKTIPLKSDTLVSHKIMTSEQAAKITDLSASLAQFFGNAALNVAATGIPPSQPFLNAGSMVIPSPKIAPSIQPGKVFETNGEHGLVSNGMMPIKSDISNPPTGSCSVSDSRMEESQISSKSLIPESVNDGTNGCRDENIDAMQVELNVDSPCKKVNETETGGLIKNEDKANLEDADADDRADGDSKRTKDVKGLRMFKCALVEFVKDILKPIWKEGQLSKEAHKTIVKKVVDKVTGAMQSPNIPQTREKIDLYLAHSKTKLCKLVQAYVEKYVKN